VINHAQNLSHHPVSGTHGSQGLGWQEPVACGGVAVFPGDVVVVDDDGAILIPDAYLDDVLTAGPEQEKLEAWILREVEAGALLPGLYPPNAENQARYARGEVRT